MDNNEAMRIGDLMAIGNTWKLILMRLVSGLISYFVVLIALLTFRTKYYDVIIFMYFGLFNFFEFGLKSTCLNYIRNQSGGVELSDIFYPFTSYPVRFIVLSLLSVLIFPLLFLFEILLYNLGIHIPFGALILIEIIVISIVRYLLFIVPYIAIDYPEESILDIISTGLFFERKLDFVAIVFSKTPIPIVYIIIMLFNGFSPNGFLPESIYYFVMIGGGIVSIVLLLINVPRIDMAYAVLYNDVIKTYYEEDGDEESFVNPYITEYEESGHEYGDFSSDDFLD